MRECVRRGEHSLDGTLTHALVGGELVEEGEDQLDERTRARADGTEEGFLREESVRDFYSRD